MKRTSPKATKAVAPRIAVVVSRYNASITGRLLEGARAAFDAAGGTASRLVVVDVPGAFELPALSLAAARMAKVDGVLALGCIIKGETRHDEYLAYAVAQGLVDVTMRTGVPVALGVLTTENVKQAKARAGGKAGNKGAEGMEALLETIRSIRQLAGEGGGANARATRPDKARAKGAR